MPAFYGMRWFIALLTRDRLLTPCLLIPFLKSHYSVILPSTPRSSKWSLSPQVSSPNPCMHLCVSYVPLALPISCLIWSLNNIWWGVHIISFSLCSSIPCYLVPLRPKYRSQHPIVKHPQPLFLLQCRSPSSVYSSAHLMFYLFRQQTEHKMFCTEWW